MVGKFGANTDVGKGRHPWEDHTYHGDVCAPLVWGGLCGTDRDVESGVSL